jgi:hypothetical protein
MAESRIYHVEMYGKGEQHGVDHLVDATSKAAAVRYVFQAYGTAALAEGKLIAHLVGKGVPVERASGEAEAE